MPLDQKDLTQRFIFDDADIRGEYVRLDNSLTELFKLHAYAPGVKILLGEMLCASALLTATLKFEGKLILQARGEGQIPLIMAESTHDRKLRGIARGAEQATSQSFTELMSQGQLAITIDPIGGNRYQGIVSLEADSLAKSLDAYFDQSEQLSTRLWLACDGDRASGLLLQQLPAEVAKDPALRAQQWEHATTLADTLQDEELLQLDSDTLLYRLFHEDEVRLFDPEPAEFSCSCSCSRERSYGAIASLPRDDIQSLLQEMGEITVDCEFCNMQYRFDHSDFSELELQPDAPVQH
jgi:molecular chaperone Hsp33